MNRGARPLGLVSLPGMTRSTTRYAQDRQPRRGAHTWATLSDIGYLFGLSGHQVGQKLKALGLADTDGTPSARAMDEGLVDRGLVQVYLTSVRNFPRDQITWHRQKIYERLRGLGLPSFGAPGDPLFSLASEVHTQIKQAQRRAGKDLAGARWVVSSARQRIRQHMELYPVATHQARGSQLLVTFTQGFGYSQALAEDLLGDMGVPVEALRRHLLGRAIDRVRVDLVTLDEAEPRRM